MSLYEITPPHEPSKRGFGTLKNDMKEPEPSYSKDNNKVIQMTTLKGERNRIIYTLRNEIELQVWQEMLEIVGGDDENLERSRIRTIVEDKIKKLKENI